MLLCSSHRVGARGHNGPMCQLLGLNCRHPTDAMFSFAGFAQRAGITDHHALRDDPVRANAILEHCGSDVLAAGGNEDLLLAPGDAHESVVIDLAEIA